MKSNARASRVFRISLIALAVAAASGLGMAQEATRLAFDIPPLPLDQALRAYSQATKQQIVFDEAVVRQSRSDALQGSMTPEAALAQLLKGSGLVATKGPGGILMVRPGQRSDGAERTGDEPQVVVVTGTHIRGAPPAGPLTEVTALDMERAGHNDLGQALRALPIMSGGGSNRGVTPGAGGSGDNGDLAGASTANLRGMGSGATLTLVNGHRMSFNGLDSAVDLSAIPLVAVDRMEILADGGSALYGSDAVAGVVNVILKKRFDGVATSARFGTTSDGGGTQQQYSGIVGKSSTTSGAWIALDYVKENGLVARQRHITSEMQPDTHLINPLERVTSVASGFAELGNNMTLRVDVSAKDTNSSFRQGTTADQPVTFDGQESARKAQGFSLAPSLDMRLPGQWQASVSGLYAFDKTHSDSASYFGGTLFNSGFVDIKNTTASIELRADGPVMQLPAGALRASIGAGHRLSKFKQELQLASANVTGDLSSNYVYGEVFVPLVSPGMGLPAVKTLSLSAALRSEDYRSIGSTTTPKLGLLYQPTDELKMKLSWGKSFKVPTFDQLYSSPSAILFPTTAYGTQFPADATYLFLVGGNPGLKPEKSTSTSFRLEFDPTWAPDLRLGLTYFRTRYTDRIAVPVPSLSGALNNPDYAKLITPNPTQAQQDAAIAPALLGLTNATGQAYDPAAVIAILDSRNLNLTRTSYSGVDIDVSYPLQLGSGHALTLMASATYLESSRQLNAGGAIETLAGRAYQSPRVRARLGAMFERGDLAVSGFVNHSSANTDSSSGTPVKVKAYTTLDVTASKTFARDLSIGLSVINLFNRMPQKLDVGDPISWPYDSTNYSITGRTINLSVNKKW